MATYIENSGNVKSLLSLLGEVTVIESNSRWEKRPTTRAFVHLGCNSLTLKKCPNAATVSWMG